MQNSFKSLSDNTNIHNPVCTLTNSLKEVEIIFAAEYVSAVNKYKRFKSCEQQNFDHKSEIGVRKKWIEIMVLPNLVGLVQNFPNTHYSLVSNFAWMRNQY